MSYDEKDSYDEEDLIRAFTRISNTRRASAVTLGDTCRQIWRQDTCQSANSGCDDSGVKLQTEYRVVVLGNVATGKTSIISQLLYDAFPEDHTPTIEDMYRAEFDMDGVNIALNIQDTGGSYVDDFPAMVGVSLQSADAVVLVFSVCDINSWVALERLRMMVVTTTKLGTRTPVVVVGNMVDSTIREVTRVEVEAKVMFDWNFGYKECSAKLGTGISQIFLELLQRVKLSLESDQDSPSMTTPVNMRRRKSLPQVPAFHRIKKSDISVNPSFGLSSSGSSSPSSGSLSSKRRKSNIMAWRKNTCKIQ